MTYIRQCYPTLVANDKKLADYILSQPGEARHLNSQQLVAKAGVGQSNVVKLVQKLGFKGFPMLKLALNGALASSPDPHSVPVYSHIRGDDPLCLVGEKLIRDSAAIMYALLDVNTGEILREAVTLLCNARCVVVTGIDASGLVVRSFSWRLMKIGINAVSGQDMHALLVTTRVMSSDDLLLVISYSGERREINMAAGEALRVGCKVLTIVGLNPNALQQQAAHCLCTTAEEQATHSAATSSISVQMMLADLLFMGLVRQDLERAPEHIRHSEALVKKLVWAENGRIVPVLFVLLLRLS